MKPRLIILTALLALSSAQAAETVINGISATGNPEAINSTSGSLHAFGEKLAGERTEDSTTGADYLNAAQETKCSVVDVADNSTTVYNAPARLYKIYVNTALSAHALPIVDGSTTKFTLITSLQAGQSVDFPGARFDTTLVVDPNDAATGNITVCWAPLDTGVTY